MSRPFSLSTTNVFDETMQNITPTNICGQKVIVSQEHHRKIFDHLVGSITSAPANLRCVPQCPPTSTPCHNTQQVQNNFIPNAGYLDMSNLLSQLQPQVAFEPSLGYQPNCGQLQQNYLNRQPNYTTLTFTFPPKKAQQMQNFFLQPPIEHVSQWKFHANKTTSTLDLNEEAAAANLKAKQVTFQDKESQCDTISRNKSVSLDDNDEKPSKCACCSCSNSSINEKQAITSKRRSRRKQINSSSEANSSDDNLEELRG